MSDPASTPAGTPALSRARTPSSPVGEPDPAWWQSAVVYQIYPRSFADSDGDGIGDLRGIIQHVDHLVDLGVDVVWLSPVYPSPQADNGYDISDYCDIDPVFGTLADIDELLARLHDAGIKLVMDVVFNHTSDEHPWFVESRSSRDNPKRDWYIWRPPRPGFAAGDEGAEPTNWGSAFSGSAWALDETTGEYYLHLFGVKQPDLNWDNPEVRQELYRVMRWWLDRGVDGFRMDVIDMISKDPAFPDASPPSGVDGDAGTAYADGSPFYGPGPRLAEYLREMRAEVFGDHADRYITVGEMPFATVENARRYTGPGGGLDMVFQFEHVELDRGATKWDVIPFDLRRLKASLGRWQAGLAEEGWNSLYWDNHDQPRAVSRFGDDARHRVESATMLAAVLHLHRGTPFIYQGEELGMTNYPFADLSDCRDIETLNWAADVLGDGRARDEVLEAVRQASRDNARTPMQWDATEQGGFTTGHPWIAIHPNHTEINVERERSDPDSVLAFYRSLIELRHTDPVVSQGSFEMLLPDHSSVYAFRRRLGAAALVVVGSFSEEETTVTVPVPASAERVLGNYPAEPLDPSGRRTLRPWEVIVLRSTGIG